MQRRAPSVHVVDRFACVSIEQEYQAILLRELLEELLRGVCSM